MLKTIDNRTNTVAALGLLVCRPIRGAMTNAIPAPTNSDNGSRPSVAP